MNVGDFAQVTSTNKVSLQSCDEDGDILSEELQPINGCYSFYGMIGIVTDVELGRDEKYAVEFPCGSIINFYTDWIRKISPLEVLAREGL